MVKLLISFANHEAREFTLDEQEKMGDGIAGCVRTI